jgi:bifunctional non-homologous end joining protein LigD
MPSAETAKKKLSFVVQQHNATNMHWDFRLEMDGVLVSWAVPKGPSTDPAVKRLAIQVEDHNFDYKDFEGIISGEHYGAGKVIIWDEGYYEPVNLPDEASSLHDDWLAGRDIKFVLHGHKLKGLWGLFLTAGGRFGPNSWLMVKKKDEFAAPGEIVREKPESVRSGKTVDEVSEADGCIGCETWD